MADLKKVIKGLELCKEACYMENCPYWNGSIIDGSCMLKLHDDALSLLKEQEAGEPDSEHHLFVCPVCRNVLRRNQKFCHECGKRIEWEGR